MFAAVPADQRVTLAPRALSLGGRDLPLVSGAMHYFRVPRRQWGRCLKAIRELGFPSVETYVPWGIHELRRGKFDFAGGRDLGAFLDAAEAEGLQAILRPGPHINAELAWFGLPERVLTDEKMQSRTARGTKSMLLIPPRGFPIPSYASPDFLAEVHAWFAAFAEVAAPRLWPKGPVVAIQVDNEHGYFFRGGAYDADYSDAALDRWSKFSDGKEPPRRFDAQGPADLALHLAWLEFREAEVVAALSAMRAMLDELGLGGVPRYHNFPPAEPGISDVAAAESVLDVAGLDLYHTKKQYAVVRRRALYLAGSSRLPYVPEMGIGSFPWGLPSDDDAAMQQLLNALMHGVAAWNGYMLVERDRWYGSPISVDGEVRAGIATPLRTLNAALDEAGWTGLERRAEIGLLVPRSYGRLALASSHLGSIGPFFGELLGIDGAAAPREASFGLDGPVQIEQAEWRDAIVDALSRAHLPFVIVDASAPDEMLARRKALVVPTFDLIEPALVARLKTFVANGGILLTGPRAPKFDSALHPSKIALPGENLPAEALTDRALLDRAVAKLPSLREAPAKEPDVDTSLYRRADGAPALLFVGTSANRPRTATVVLESAATVEDIFSGEKFSGETLAIPLSPYSVRLFRFA
jgi:beta-galactosidase